MKTVSAVWVPLIIFALVLACGCGGPVKGGTPLAPSLALVHATLIDGTGAAPLTDAVLLISGGKIVAVGPAARVKVPPGTHTIDLSGTTLLPGFINTHVHDAFDRSNLQAWAQGGVTTVRDESALPDTIAQLKTFQAEVLVDPHYARLVSSGTMLAVPGGYGNLFVSSPEEARQAVLKEIDEGVNAIKVALEDGYAGRHDLPKLTPEELKAIVTTAHAYGLPVSAHITQGVYLKEVLDAGVDDIAHTPYDFVPAEDFEQMVRQGVYLIPTFTVYRNYGAPLAVVQSNLRQFVALGGRVALGNDYDGGPGSFELGIPMYEIQMMSQSGMTPMQIILASTSNAAHVLRLDNVIGTLEAGKDADILVIRGDPLQNLQALTAIRMVIHGGSIIRDDPGN